MHLLVTFIKRSHGVGRLLGRSGWAPTAGHHVSKFENPRMLPPPEQARQKAEAATDSYTRNDFLDLERRWLSLAHSYEFSERLIYPSQRLTPAAHPRA